MKKIICICFLAAFLFPVSLTYGATEPARPARAILTWLNHQIVEIQAVAKRLRDERRVDPGKTCIDALGWKLISESRLKLGIDDLKRSTQVVQGNACLRNDLLAIDNRIQRMVRMIGESEITCSLSDLERFENVMAQAFFLKNALEEYGSLTTEDEDRARRNRKHPLQEFEKKYGFIPEELEDANFSLVDPQYQSTDLCPDPGSILSFAQVKEQFQGLLLKIDQIREAGESFGSSASGFASGNAFPLFTHDQSRRIREKGRYDAYSWFNQNVQRPAEDFGVYLDYKSEGPPLIEKQDKQVQNEIATDKTRAEDSVIPPRDVKEVSQDDLRDVRSQIHQTMQEEDIYVKDTEEFLTWAIGEAKERQEVSIPVTDAIEQPFIELTRRVEETTKYLRKAYDLMEGICRRDGACK